MGEERGGEQKVDPRLIVLAVFALVAIGVVAAILIGRSGGEGSDHDRERRRLQEGRSAEAEDGQLRAAEAGPAEGRASDGRRQDQLRHLRDRARHRAGAEDRQLLRLPLRGRLLRRPHLPPHRSGIRHPGWGSGRHQRRWGRLQRSTRSRRRTSPTRKAWWRWRRARPSRPAAPAASSTSSPTPTPGCRPNTRWSARSTRAWTWSSASASSAPRPKQPKQTVLIEEMTIEEG